ncbi:MAG: hypothetical protein ACO3TG_02020 [Minisyncoccia bacterium]
MNDLNPDKKPHILSSPESPEGGTGNSGQANMSEQDQAELRGEVLKDQQGVEAEENLEVNGLEDEMDFDLENFDNLIAQTAIDLESTEKPPFELDPETGLSLQGSQIEDLKTQLEALDNDESARADLSAEIEANRMQNREILNTKLEEYKDIRKGINTKIQASINQSNTPNLSIEDFISGNEQLQAKVAELEQVIQKGEDTLNDFDTETKTQVEKAIQDKKNELQQQLTEAQAGYVESGAEGYDNKTLLELQLQEQLIDPDALFSDKNIDQILTTYGAKEGLDKLQDLKQESNKAREQADRDKIKGEVFAYVDDYNNNLELAESLSTDIQTKLEILQQSDPDSETIQKALSLEGAKRLDYLLDSRDSQLEELAFWANRDVNIDKVLAENPQFAKYLDKETNNRYEKQQQEIREGRIDGASYLGSRMDNARGLDIDNRISSNLERYKGTEIEALQRELYSLQFDESGNYFDREDQSMIDQKEQLRPAEIEKFKSELSQALKSGQIQFENGKLSLLENIPAKNEKINQELAKLLATTKPILEIAGYAIQSLDGLADISSKINEAKEKAEKRPLGLGKNTAKALEKLAQEVLKVMEQYNQLQGEKQSNISKFEADRETKGKLDETYNKLPQAIKDKFTALENANLDLVTQAIDAGVSEIQNYETPPEIVEKRQKITDLESQIAETQSITAPTASTQPST